MRGQKNPKPISWPWHPAFATPPFSATLCSCSCSAPCCCCCCCSGGRGLGKPSRGQKNPFSRGLKNPSRDGGRENPSWGSEKPLGRGSKKPLPGRGSEKPLLGVNLTPEVRGGRKNPSWGAKKPTAPWEDLRVLSAFCMCFLHVIGVVGMEVALGSWLRAVASGCDVGGWVAASAGFDKVSVHPESNQGSSDICLSLQSDALPTEL